MFPLDRGQGMKVFGRPDQGLGDGVESRLPRSGSDGWAQLRGGCRPLSGC